MTATEAFEKILALRDLTRTTRVQTYRAQRTILQSLTNTDLAEVSLKLAQAAEVSR
jgi:hypothetical protein